MIQTYLSLVIPLYLRSIFGTNKTPFVLKQNDLLQPRSSFLKSIKNATKGVFYLSVLENALKSEANADDTIPREDRKIMKLLSSGVIFTDIRVGTGKNVSKDDFVLMHLRAETLNGLVLFDTKLDGNGRPILHELNTVEDFNIFGGDSSKRSKVTLGVEDAIISRGVASWEGGSGKIDPMRQGGIRSVIVPDSLAYGQAGISRYDAFRMKLRRALPREAILRYEIELLHCLEDEVKLLTKSSGEEKSALVCCIEENYPCETKSDLN